MTEAHSKFHSLGASICPHKALNKGHTNPGGLPQTAGSLTKHIIPQADEALKLMYTATQAHEVHH